ncbi:MAG: SLC13 family permease [Flavonifractor plautii]
MIGALVVVATGVLTEQEAIDNLNMDTIMLYVGVSVLGTALGGTGAAELMGSALASLLGNTTNGYIIGAFYIVAWLMTSFLYNRAVTQVLYPLAIMTCVTMNVDPIGPIILCNIASMSSPGHPYGHRRCSLGDDRRRLQSKDHLQGRHGARRGPWCGQRVGDHDHVPYLNRLLQPACVLIKIPARYPVREF